MEKGNGEEGAEQGEHQPEPFLKMDRHHGHKS